MPETSALGAAMAAGLADGIAVWNLDSTVNNSDTSADVFTASIPESGNDSNFFVLFPSSEKQALEVSVLSS